MTLTEIIPLLIAGNPVRRQKWRKNEQYLFMHVSIDKELPVTILYNDREITKYNISNDDAWSDDWEVMP